MTEYHEILGRPATGRQVRQDVQSMPQQDDPRLATGFRTAE
ncbi:MAG: hypothetical protein AB7L91_18150 [Dehalococcoidia bacterium]